MISTIFIHHKKVLLIGGVGLAGVLLLLHLRNKGTAASGDTSSGLVLPSGNGGTDQTVSAGTLAGYVPSMGGSSNSVAPTPGVNAQFDVEFLNSAGSGNASGSSFNIGGGSGFSLFNPASWFGGLGTSSSSQHQYAGQSGFVEQSSFTNLDPTQFTEFLNQLSNEEALYGKLAQSQGKT